MGSLGVGRDGSTCGPLQMEVLGRERRVARVGFQRPTETLQKRPLPK